MRLEIFRSSILRLITAGTITGIMFFPSLTKAQGQQALHAQRQDNDNVYTQVNLVSNGYVPAKVMDSNLVNPWGMTAGPMTPPWISNQVTNTSTIDPVSVVESGGSARLTVSIPTVPGGPNGPTGIAYNLDLTSGGFGIRAPSGMMSTVPAIFLFADLNGTLLGWNPASSGGLKSAVIAVNNHDTHAVYTGLAMAMVGSDVNLYAADFSPSGGIQVFNSSWGAATNLATDAFHDPMLPKLPASEVWAPYNIANLDGKMYVAYDAQPATGGLPITHMGLGVIGVFTTDGKFIRNLQIDPGRRDRDDDHGRDGRALGMAGQLDAPWGMAMAPAKFGRFSNDLLVGNFGNGEILAFRPDGRFAGTLRGTNHFPLKNGFLWALWFGNGVDGADPNTLYITTGGSNEFADGLFAAITPAR